MSNIQKYIKRKYTLGGITMPQMDYGLNFLPQEPGSFNLEMPQGQIGGFNMGNYDIQTPQKSGFGQMLSNFGSQFGGEQFKAGLEQVTGGQGFGDLLGGAISGEGPGAGILGAVSEGISGGGGLDVQGIIGKATGGGGFDPLSMVGSGLDTLADDQDATTYSVGEIGADVAGAAMGAGRMLSGDIIGGGKQLLGEVVDIGKSVFGRKKARKEQRAAEKKAKQDHFTREGESAEQRVAASVMGGQMSRANEAADSMAAMQEKYKIAKHGARIDYKEGGVHDGTRPEDLKYMKYTKGGVLNSNLYPEINKYLKGGKIKFDDGGKTDSPSQNLMDLVMSGQLTANTPVSDKEKKHLEDSKKQAAKNRADELMAGIENNPVRGSNLEKAINITGDAAFGVGAASTATGVGSLPGGWLMGMGSALSSVPEVTKVVSEKLIQGHENLKYKLKGTVAGDLFGIDEDRIKADFSKYTGKTKDYDTDVDYLNEYLSKENVDEFVKRHGKDISDMAEVIPFTKSAKYLHKVWKGGKKTKKYGEELLSNLMGDKAEDPSKMLSKGGAISFDVKDYYSDNYKKYISGGVTPGKFSHKENPLTVVDKKGNDTGMELTGGEGVFDKSAMSKLDKYKATKNYEKAGKLVFSEMNSWKDAGTAKYGTRIKYK